MVYPEPYNRKKKAAAFIYGWDCPLLTASSTRIGFEHVAPVDFFSIGIGFSWAPLVFFGASMVVA